MTERTFTAALPSPAKSTSWPEDAAQTGSVARTGATIPTMPFVCPKSHDRKKPVKFEWTAIGRDGRSHDFFEIFRPGNNVELPGPTAGRVLMALLSKSPESGGQNLRVSACLEELAEICRLDKNQITYDRIRQALGRLQGAEIESNAFWDYANQQYLNQAIGLFSSDYGSISSPTEEFEVRWTSAVTELISAWSRPLNLDHLFSLDTCLARKLYQVSSLGIYQQGEFVEDLTLLCHGQLGISQSRKYASQLKQSLSEPIESLREKNLIDVTIEEDTKSPSIKSGWLVRARPMEGMREIHEEIDDPQYWASHLANRGMMDKTGDPLAECRDFVDRKGVDRVRHVVKEFDRRRSKESDATPIRHAGWLKHILENDVDLENDSRQEKSESVMIY